VDDLVAEETVGGDELIDFLDAVHGGGVVFAAEGAGDLGVGEGELGFHEVHGDLAGGENVFFATVAGELGDGEVEVGGGGFDDVFGAGAGAEFFGVLEFGFEAGEGEAGAEAHLEEAGVVESALELADVGGVFFGDEFDDVGAEVEFAKLGFGVEDGTAGFKVGRLDGDNHALFAAGGEAIGEVGDAGWRSVGADDDLLVVLLEVVKGVEEFFLAFFFAFEKLHVVDDEDVVFAVFFGEAGEFFLDAGDEIFIEGVDGYI